MPDYKLSFIIDAENKGKAAFNEVGKQVDSLKGKLDDMKPAFKTMAVVGTAAFAAISAFAISSVKAFMESEKALAIVDTAINNFDKKTLESLGGSIETAKKQVRAFGTELQKLGGISDEEAAKGVTKLTQITGDYTKAQDAARIAADLSIYKSIDYASAVDIVGKVISGNVSILSRYGIQLEKGATAEEAMAELARRTAGQYEAYGKTLSGQTAILKERFDDLKESIGGTLVPILTQVLEKISPIIEKTLEWVNTNPELAKNLIITGMAVSGFISIVGLLGLALPGIITGITALNTALMFMATTPIGMVILAIGAVIGWIILMTTHWNQFKINLLALWNEILLGLKKWKELIIGVLTDVKDAFVNAFGWIQEHVFQPFLSFIDRIASAIASVISAARSIGNAVSGSIKGISGGGGFQFGTEFVPRTGMYMLHRGEVVNPAGGGSSIVVNINGGYYLSETVAEEIGDMIIQKIKRKIKL